MEWPISWVTTYSTSLPMSESGSGNDRARSSSGPTWMKYHSFCSSMMLWYMLTSPFRISPERGSTIWPPVALATVDGRQ